jgi:hypothetical protein
MNRLRRVFLILGGILSFTQVAWADGGIGPIFLLILPLPWVSILTARLTFGISLILIIAIEALVLKLRARLSCIKSLILSIVANIFSMLIGLGIWGVGVLGLIYAIIAALIAGTLLFAYMLISICRRTGYYSILVAKRIPHSVFYVISVLVFPLLCITAWFVGRLPGSLTFSLSSCVSWGGTLLIGFILTIISEGFIVIRFVPENHPKIVSTVVLMNVLSYIVLIAVAGFLILYKGNSLEVW